MKCIKWKSIIITCIVCLLPILLGVALWNKLPDEMAIHFNFNNEPDNFASKGSAVFGLPLLMAVLQVFCCVVSDINSKKYGECRDFERASKWIIPFVTVVLYGATLGYSLGWRVDIRRVASLILGVVFLVLGFYLPKLTYIKNYNLSPEKAKKINRFAGNGMVIMGILALLSILLPPVALVVWVCLVIVYAIITAVYGVKIAGER